MPLSADGWFNNTILKPVPRMVERIKQWRLTDETYAAVLMEADPGINSYESVLCYPPEEIDLPTLQPVHVSRERPEIEDVNLLLGWQPILSRPTLKVQRGGVSIVSKDNEDSPTTADLFPFVATFQTTFHARRPAAQQGKRETNTSDICISLTNFDTTASVFEVTWQFVAYTVQGNIVIPRQRTAFNELPVERTGDSFAELIETFSFRPLRFPRVPNLAPMGKESAPADMSVWEPIEFFATLSYSVTPPKAPRIVRSELIADLRRLESAEALELGWQAVSVRPTRKPLGGTATTDVTLESIATVEQTVSYQPWQVVSARPPLRPEAVFRTSTTVGWEIPSTDDAIYLTWDIPTQRPFPRRRVPAGEVFFVAQVVRKMHC